ncbi:MAG TPA: hypothetical protein VHL53_18070 [Acidimicrobiia bacterium]|nr:hypothetical protein [Acidimicrobiia bacterium]
MSRTARLERCAAALGWAALTLAGALAPLRPAVADGAGPEIVDITDKCPVPEGGYRYLSDFFEYRIRVPLARCPWYHGETVRVTGTLTRTDPLTGADRHDATVYCEPGAPPADEQPHGGHGSPLPPPPVVEPAPGPPTFAPSGAAHHEESHRPPGSCFLSIVIEHPPVEHARYQGELSYPSSTGPRHETLDLECTTLEDFGGCNAPGALPDLTPTPPDGP